MVLALMLAVLVLAVPATAAADGRYIALGDSVAASSDSYVDRFGAWLQADEGVTDVHKVAVWGETSGSILGAQLSSGLALIGDETDTRVVSIDIGGNDHILGLCGGPVNGWNLPSCPFADNLATLLARLRTALDADPGEERLLLLGYYNPMSGLGGDGEAFIDAGLRGADMQIDGSRFGGDWGMTDVTGWLTCRFGGTLVDAWAAFKAGGQALMADSAHPNATGQQVLADLFRDPSAGGPTPSCQPTSPFATTSPDAGDGVMRGVVEPRLEPSRWWFEFGATAAYGETTPVEQLPASAGARDVHAALPAPATYHVRLVAENDRGRFTGADQVVTGSPGVALTTTRQSLSTVRRSGLRLTVSCPATCTISARLQITRKRALRLGLVPRSSRVTIGSRSAGRTGAGSKNLTLRLTRTVRPRLRGARKVVGTLAVKVRTDAGTQTHETAVTLTRRSVRLR